MDIKGADRLESSARPAGFKSPGAHVVGAGHYGGGKKERVFQRDPAELRPEKLRIRFRAAFQFRPDLFGKPCHKSLYRDFMRPDTRFFAGGGALQAHVSLRQTHRGILFVVEPYASEKVSRVQFSAGSAAGSVMAQ